MARQARIKSMTGIYHVMLKGIDSRNIFRTQVRTQGDGSIVHFCWLKNTEVSVWKRFGWWLRFPAFVCFQSVAPVSAQPNSRKNLNSPTSPSFLS